MPRFYPHSHRIQTLLNEQYGPKSPLTYDLDDDFVTRTPNPIGCHGQIHHTELNTTVYIDTSVTPYKYHAVADVHSSTDGPTHYAGDDHELVAEVIMLLERPQISPAYRRR